MVLVRATTYLIYVNRELDEVVDLGTNKTTGKSRGTIGTFEGWCVHEDGTKYEGQSTPVIFPQGFTQNIIDGDSLDEAVSEVRVSCVCSAFRVLISFLLQKKTVLGSNLAVP